MILLYFRLNEIYVQVSICNVVRGVMEGKALVSILADVVEDADPQTIEFLVLVGIEISQFSNDIWFEFYFFENYIFIITFKFHVRNVCQVLVRKYINVNERILHIDTN